jgi:predicted regulator of Ras-like GTPase activity (Roadblock/LC7/MglB family)
MVAEATKSPESTSEDGEGDSVEQDLDWLVTNFVDRVQDAAHAVVVSADGLPMGFSAAFPADRADQVAAVTSGLSSLTQGAARAFQGGSVVQTAVEMEAGLLVVMAISNGSSLAVLAAPDCDLGLIAYEMSLLVERVGRELTPATRTVVPPRSLSPRTEAPRSSRTEASR